MNNIIREFISQVSLEKGGTITEYWQKEMPEDMTAEQYMRNVLRMFNQSLKPGESRRTLDICAEIDVHTEGFAHVMEKSNLVTTYYKGRQCDEFKCKYCKAKGRKFVLGGLIVMDKRYSEVCER